MPKYQQLSHLERYTISLLLTHRLTHAEIARWLQRSPSTISRELGRNRCTSDGAYRSEIAIHYASGRRKRVHRGFRHSPIVWSQVILLLKEKWSPEQISNRLRLSDALLVSHQTIYRYVKEDRKNGGLLYVHLRCSSKQRRKHHNTSDSRGILPGKRHISQRPPGAESRLRLGHWEADTVIGADRHHCILTFVERKSGLAVIRKLRVRTAEEVIFAARPVLQRFANHFRTLTMDNDTEFHGYKLLESGRSLRCYFATPYHSWERGSNENLNGLIRQYLPKGTCMRTITQADCDWIALKLNTRPRKRHGYKTPQEVYDACA